MSLQSCSKQDENELSWGTQNPNVLYLEHLSKSEAPSEPGLFVPQLRTGQIISPKQEAPTSCDDYWCQRSKRGPLKFTMPQIAQVGCHSNLNMSGEEKLV